MKRTMILIVSLLILGIFLLSGCSGSDNSDSVAWDTSFSEAGFSVDEIESYREVLNTVGINDYHDVSIIDNGDMTIVRGKIYDSDNLQLNVTMENHNIIYNGLTGIPAKHAEPYFNWRGQLKTRTVNTTEEVDLYADTDGGYLAVLDWENKTVSEYNG